MDQLDQSQHHQQPSSVGMIPSTSQMSYYPLPYQTSPMVAAGTPVSQQYPTQQLQEQQQQLQMFWQNQRQEVEQTTDFKNHSLPLARIKKIMKTDEDVKMISAEAPVLFAKACEMFILDLTLHAWLHTEENKRRTLQRNDIAAAVSRTDVFDFLVDIMPRDEFKEECLGYTKPTVPAMGSTGDAFPYYYMPPQHQGLVPGTASDQPTVYTSQLPQQQQMAYIPWQQQQSQLPKADS